MTLDTNSIPRFFVLLFGVVIGAYICVQALLSNTSVLGQLYLYVAIAAFILGLLSPRTALFALILSTGYIEYFKRLMIIAGTPTYFDVGCALATPPLLCAGATINLVLGVAMGKRTISRELVVTFCFAVALFIFAIFIVQSKSAARSMGGIANTAAYPFLMVLVPAFLSDIKDKIKLFRLIYVVFIGVALYMFYHNFYGLTGFEIDYLKSGLSLEARILSEDASTRRCFSTMNGASIVSTMCALMFFWSFVSLEKITLIKRFAKYVCAIVFACAAYFTLSRTGWFCGITGLFCYIMFQNFKLTIVTYVMGITAVVSLVVFSPMILEQNLMAKADSAIKNTFNIVDAKAEKAATLGTFNGRLLGYKNLMTKSMMWTPFGWKAAGKDVAKFEALDLGDDTIVWSIIKYGFVTCIVVGFGLLVFLFKVHRLISMLPKGLPEKKLGNLCLATIVGIIIGGIGNGAQFQVFPLNVYLFLCLALVFSMYLRRSELLQNVQYTQGLPKSS